MNDLSKLYDLIPFKYTPVSIDEFINNDYYLGSSFVKNDQNLIFEIWQQRLREVFPDPVRTTSIVVFKGGIGTGKSTMSTVVLLYDIYKICCMDNPKSFFEVMAGNGIGFKIFSIYKYKANKFVEGLNNLLKTIPFFIDEYADHDSSIHDIVISAASNESHLISEDIISVMVTEVNFLSSYEFVNKIIDSILKRIKSRFINALGVCSHVILDSSDTVVDSPLERWLIDSAYSPSCKVFSTSQWVAKPKSFFNDGGFYVYAGDLNIRPKILSEDESKTVEDILKENPQFLLDRIIYAPNELRKEFENDIIQSLNELAGISTYDNQGFIDDYFISQSMIIESPIDDIISVDFYNSESIMGLMGMKQAIESLPNDRHIFIRVDLGLVSDNCGLAIGYVSDLVKNTQSGVLDPSFRIPIACAISRSAGQETSIRKIRDFILEVCNLKNVYSVSTDQFQSSQLRQDLEFEKIKTSLISVDRSDEDYLLFRRLLSEKRLTLPKNDLLRHELSKLVHKREKRKVDHPENKAGSNYFSKDIADACCGLITDIFKNGDKVLNVRSLDLDDGYKSLQSLLDSVKPAWINRF